MKYEVQQIKNNSDLEKNLDLSNRFLTLNAIYGSALKYYALTDKGGNMVASFCVYSFNKLWQKHIITPPFLTDVQLNTVCNSKNAAQINNFYRDVVSSIADFLKSSQHTYLELVFPKNHSDALPFLWNNFKIGIRYSYFLDLTLTEEQLIQNMSTQRRKNIRDAEKLDLETRSISDAELVQSKAIETLSSKNAKFNEDVVKQISQLAKKGKLITKGIYKNNELMAMSSAIQLGDECTYLFGWNDEKAKSCLGPYALWQCILSSQKSADTFNFAGSQIPSIEKYFRGFGGSLTPMISVISDKRKLTKQFT